MQKAQIQKEAEVFAAIQRILDWLYRHRSFKRMRYFDSIIAIVWLRRGCNEIYSIHNQMLRERDVLARDDITLILRAPFLFRVDDSALEGNISRVIKLIKRVEGW